MSVFMLGVASLMNDFSHLVDPYLELEEKYSRWAVETARGVCPFQDWECIEREARRLYESRMLRR
jgi:hypothetical protein